MCIRDSLWEAHINNLIIKDVYESFNKEKFHEFIDNNLENIYEDINKNIIDFYNTNKLTIAFSNKSELVSVIKDMLLKNELDISFAQDFVDLDKVREEMIMYSTPLDTVSYTHLDVYKRQTLDCGKNTNNKASSLFTYSNIW